MNVSLEFSSTAFRFQNVFTFIAERRGPVPFSMAKENIELMHECSPEHLRMGRVRLKRQSKEGEGNKRRMNMERGTASTKKNSPNPDGLTKA